MAVKVELRLQSKPQVKWAEVSNWGQMIPKDEALKFVDQANPHSWLLVADNLHAQVVALQNFAGASKLTSVSMEHGVIGAWDATNRTTFLLGAFALENAIKAFLVYENPQWISNGQLGKPLRSHELVALHSSSRLIPRRKTYDPILAMFEDGIESWARYPCGLDASSTRVEAKMQKTVWKGYGALMQAYGRKLENLLEAGWLGPHGFYGRWKTSGDFFTMSNRAANAGAAQERGLTARNVVRDMRGRRGASDSRAEKRAKGKLKIGVDIPAPAEIKAIVGALSGRWRPVLLTAIFTGLRASELRGLRWSDVDLDKKLLRVHQRADRFNDIGRPKSEAGEREVPLPPIVANTLREWKLICPKRDTGKRTVDGEPVKVLDLVFPNGQGKVESLANIINRALIPVQIKAGVTVETDKVDGEGNPVLAAKYTGMHALRHFYASWCINRPQDGGLGLPPKSVQDRLGHATINLTMDTYSHLFPRGEDQDELAQAELALLGG